MLTKTEGIVIRKIRFSETSIITTLYTEKYGMLSFHIPGVYSKKGSVKPSYFLPLQILDLDFYYRENQNLKKTKEIKPAFIYQNIHTDFQKVSLGLLISELLFKTILEEEENRDLYGFLKNAFLMLDEQEKQPGNFILAFLVQFTKYLGFFPNDNFDEAHPYFHLMEGRFTETDTSQAYTVPFDESRALSNILRTGLEENTRLKISSSCRKVLFEQLMKYYGLHIENFSELKSEKVFKDLFRQL